MFCNCNILINILIKMLMGNLNSLWIFIKFIDLIVLKKEYKVLVNIL